MTCKIVFQVPSFGPDFRDNHTELRGKEGDQMLIYSATNQVFIYRGDQ